MDFTLTEDQLALQGTARRFAQQELVDLADEIESTHVPPSKELVRQFAEMGFLGINTAEQYGGLGLGNVEALIVIEECAKISCAIAFPVFEANVGPIKAVAQCGSQPLRERLIPQVCSGEKVIAATMSEAQAGTALTDMTTRGVVGMNSVVINGAKRWCSGGGHADGYVAYVRLSDEPGSRGIGAVYVDSNADGLSFGSREELMGWHGVATADIFFDNVEVPLNNIVTDANGGFKKLMNAFNLERCGNAIMSLAQAQAALDTVLQYTQERQQFGKPIVDFQAVQLSIAEMAMKVEASRLLIYKAAANSQNGNPGILESSMAKCFANEISRTVTGLGVQLMGGYGYSKSYPAERRFRDAWGWGIAGGSIDIQKVNITAALLGRRFSQRS